MIVSSMHLINIRRMELMRRRDSFVTAALEGGMSWDEAKKVGENAVPDSEFEYLNELAKRQAKTEGVTMMIFSGAVVIMAFFVVGALAWKTFL